jgi:hypothetical protein
MNRVCQFLVVAYQIQDNRWVGMPGLVVFKDPLARNEWSRTWANQNS